MVPGFLRIPPWLRGEIKAFVPQGMRLLRTGSARNDEPYPQFIVLLSVLGVLCGEILALTLQGLRLLRTGSARNDTSFRLEFRVSGF
jgi:hypothetical protein